MIVAFSSLGRHRQRGEAGGAVAGSLALGFRSFASGRAALGGGSAVVPFFGIAPLPNRLIGMVNGEWGGGEADPRIGLVIGPAFLLDKDDKHGILC
jgi:hypothetical protein